MKIGLFFGSFNPLHIGHIAVANYMAKFTDLEEVWLVVSPQNPLKEKESAADAKKRLATVKKAIEGDPVLKVSDAEFSLPQPSYTIHTLEHLQKKFPEDKFALIIGSDNLNVFDQWKDHEKILNGFKIYIYPRAGSDGGTLKTHRNVKIVDAPKMDISSTFIREQIKKGKDVSSFIP